MAPQALPEEVGRSHTQIRKEPEVKSQRAQMTTLSLPLNPKPGGNHCQRQWQTAVLTPAGIGNDSELVHHDTVTPLAQLRPRFDSGSYQCD